VGEKKAVLLSFRLNDMEPISGGNGGTTWVGQGPVKFDGWAKLNGAPRNFPCAVPGSIVRHSAYYRPGVVPDAVLREP
jgi:2,3,4,5-tetrahydropyridine-2-carboxylate N-succinyltransferase